MDQEVQIGLNLKIKHLNGHETVDIYYYVLHHTNRVKRDFANKILEFCRRMYPTVLISEPIYLTREENSIYLQREDEDRGFYEI